jgi:multicomponent Na+:H+ antiporter subunit G
MIAPLTFAGHIVTTAGALFLFLAALGIIRMPDVYNRMQAGTKATTLGTLLVLGGQACIHPHWTGKLLLIALFILLTNPISSHILARAAHFMGLPLSRKSVFDALAEDAANDRKQDV